MALSLLDFAAKLRSVRNKIADSVEEYITDISESTLTLIKDRSINEGIDIDGKPNNKAKYSTRKINTQKFKGKERSRSGAKYIEANALGTWHDFRKAQGLNSEPVNLSYSNEMWSNIAVVKAERTVLGKAQSYVGSSDPETIKKIESNTELFGDFLRPLPEELKLSQTVLQEKILKLLR